MSLRWRLALLYGTATAILLVPAALLAYSLHVKSEYQDLDESLVGTAQHLQDQLLAAPPGESLRDPPVATDVSVRLYHRTSEPIQTHGASAEPPLTPVEVINRADGPAYPALASLLPGTASVAKGAFATASDSAQGGRVRLYALPAGPNGDLGYVLAWRSLQALDQSTRFLGIVLAGVAVVGVLAAGAGTYAVAGNVLRPVAAMTRTARAIASSRGFTRRVPEPGRMDEIGRLARTFNEMLSSLEEAYRLEQRFVADAAHELRTPITAIQGNIELFVRNAEMPADEKQEALSYLDSEARRLSRIVSELLTLARADAGQKVELRPVELDRVLLDALVELRPLAAGHNLQVEAIEPVQVSGDQDRLKELILNLVDNALKYTPVGGRISVSLRREARRVELLIADSGVGISARDLPHIFERFYRANAARSRDEGGSGLGLAIVRWIVDQHGGDITVQSTPAKGTTVRVSLPVPDEPPAPARAAQRLARESSA